jgi:hypothetical protein
LWYRRNKDKVKLWRVRKILNMFRTRHDQLTNLIVARNFNAYCISCFALGGNLHANFISSFQAAGKKLSRGTCT